MSLQRAYDTMAERVASIIHRRAWSKDRRFICKSVCDKICEGFFVGDISDRVWTRLRGSEVALEEVPVGDREHALRFLGTASSDERWIALEEPLPEAFDDLSSDDSSGFDFFAEEEYWTCDEDLPVVSEAEEIVVPDVEKCAVPDEEPSLKRTRSEEASEPSKRPRRDKKVKPLGDVCGRCHGNGCVRCGWKKNMW